MPDPSWRRLPSGEPSGGIAWEKAMQANTDEQDRRKAMDARARGEPVEPAPKRMVEGRIRTVTDEPNLNSPGGLVQSGGYMAR